MNVESIPENVQWVKVRAKCTLQNMLKVLRDEVNVDVAQRNEYLAESQKESGIKFHLEDEPGTFMVHREGPGIAAACTFGIVASEITVIDALGTTLLRATIGMSDVGRCMLRVTNLGELETWQFRRRALEQLFFWY